MFYINKLIYIDDNDKCSLSEVNTTLNSATELLNVSVTQIRSKTDDKINENKILNQLESKSDFFNFILTNNRFLFYN
jgi:hypothetical protein